MLSDLQRWLIKSSARSMRKEISGQVRRTFGGGRSNNTSDVWDTATTEIPPEVGESPECQWCPICRAARRMRDSGPGIGGQLSGAGDAVASAVQDAISALDSILSKAGGGAARTGGSTRDGSAARDAAAAGDAAARDSAATADAMGSAVIAEHEHADPAEPGDLGPAEADDHDGTAGLRGSAAGDHGPGGWKPGDRLATAEIVDPDPWAEATDTDEAGTEVGEEQLAPGAEPEGELDGQGHGPDDRG